MLDLSNVTLVAVSSIKIGETLSALYNSMSGIKFAECKLITHHENLTVQPGVKVEKCDYCLLVQHDGFVLRPEKWSQEFLEYDYIGAPWPVSQDAYITFDGERVRVGNGGFSLRSKSLLDAPNKHNIPFLNDRGFYNEDGNICVYNRKKFLELGMKFAPIDIAARFSQETQMIETEGILPFGFHRTPK
jgi:hypothetical protein